jgi:hypothetical protein
MACRQRLNCTGCVGTIELQCQCSGDMLAMVGELQYASRTRELLSSNGRTDRNQPDSVKLECAIFFATCNSSKLRGNSAFQEDTGYPGGFVDGLRLPAAREAW